LVQNLIKITKVIKERIIISLKVQKGTVGKTEGKKAKV